MSSEFGRFLNKAGKDIKGAIHKATGGDSSVKHESRVTEDFKQIVYARDVAKVHNYLETGIAQ